MKMKMNTMIKFKRRAMIKGKIRMMGIKMKELQDLHHHIQECATPSKEITPWTTFLEISRLYVANICEHYSFVSSFESFKVEDALHDPNWVVAMQEELNYFKCNEVWSLVETPKQNVVGTKWVFHNKQDKCGVVTGNKTRLVAKGYSQV
jgi:hypothetical protein